MGKYSSKESKEKHNNKYAAKHALLTYSLHDHLLNEIVLTPEHVKIMFTHAPANIEFNPETFPEIGEVLTWPSGESPSLALIN
jgi:hypothetical protein